MPFGDHVISVDNESILIIWDVQSEGKTSLFNVITTGGKIKSGYLWWTWTNAVLCSAEEYLQLDFDKTVFAISAVLHPHTYMNKILVGSEQGPLQLWNVKSK